MSSTSSLAYWLNIPESNGGVNSTAKDATYLSYNVFLGLSLFGGFFGLDHLYLRSPLTCILKTFINIIFLGSWWIYDVFQAFFNRDIVKVFGLNIPGYGPSGIGAGCLIQEQSNKKHLSFFLYGLALFAGGIFGLDSFVVGDTKNGIIRILMLLSMILSPIAFIWWIYKQFMFVFKTEDVTGQYYEYFGAPKKSMSDKLFEFFPGLSGIFGPLSAPFNALTSILKVVITLLTTFSGIIMKGMDTITRLLNGIGIVPEFGKLQSELSVGVVEPATVSQSVSHSGGGNSSILPYVFMGTIAIVAVSGFILTYRRSKQNVKPKDDSPPEPGVFRKSVENPE